MTFDQAKAQHERKSGLAFHRVNHASPRSRVDGLVQVHERIEQGRCPFPHFAGCLEERRQVNHDLPSLRRRGWHFHHTRPFEFGAGRPEGHRATRPLPLPP